MRLRPGFLSIIASIAMLVTCSAHAASPPPSADAGHVDFSDWDFIENGSAYLRGAWEFYWQELLTPLDFHQGELPQASGFLHVPGSWNDLRVGNEALGGEGYGTYRLVVQVPKRYVSQDSGAARLALHLPWSFTAHALWIQDELVASNGVVGKSARTMIPEFLPITVPFTPREERFEIVVQVSNFMHRNGGLWRSPLLGTTDQIATRELVRTSLDMALFGAIVFMAIYHLTLFWSNRERPASVYLGLTALTIAIRTLVTSEHMLDRFVGGLPWDLQLRIEYTTGYVFLFTFIAFLRCVFPKETARLAVWLAGAIAASGVLVTLFTPVRFSSQFIPLYMVIFGLFVLFGATVFLLAAIRGRDGGRLTVIGGIALSCTLIHDLFNYNLIAFDISLIPLGLFTLLLFESLTLAHRIAKAFRHEIALSAENQSLLNQVNTQLVALKQSRAILAIADENLRRNLAERLHGRVQTQLLAAWHRLEVLKRTLTHQRLPDDALHMVEDAQQHIDHVREVEIRHVSHILHPSIVRVGVIPALESLADHFRESFAIKVDVDDEVSEWDDPIDNRIPESVRLVAYRVMEEALANVQAHAKAASVSVSLSIHSAEAHGQAHLAIRIMDDGQGFEPTEAKRGLGLNTIDARVTTLGGTWEILSRPGEGTTLTLRLPLSGDVEAKTGLVRDPETGLYSQSYFSNFAHQFILHAARANTAFAVVIGTALNLTALTEGRASADYAMLVKGVAEAVRSSIGDADIPCRISENSFAVLLPGASKERSEEVKGLIADRVDRLGRGLSEPIRWVAGCASYPDDASTVESLVKQATPD